jgi:uncharacterized protein
MRIAVTGSTGTVGSALLPALEGTGHEVRRVVRRDPKPGDLFWDPGAGKLDPAQLSDIDAVIHLSGEDMGQRWTDAARARIRESRIRSTEVLSHAIAVAEPRPRLLITASAVGFYGDRGDELLDERSGPGTGFLVDVVREWEAATAEAEAAGVRVVHARFGVILTAAGGMLARLLPVFKLGAGGKIGSGDQWLSWVVRHDLVRAMLFLVEHEEVRGSVNVTAPEPARNADFTRALGQAVGRPTITMVPEFALKLAYGQMAEETILVSQRVVPRRLPAAGFEFRYPGIFEALQVAVHDT